MRFRSRHVQQTIADFVEAGLTARGWVNPPVNFGATPVTFQEVEPEDAARVAPNTVSTTIQDEDANRLEQLGGGLYSVDFNVFLDIYGESSSLSLSIADDVKQLLFERAIPVIDYSLTPPSPTDEWIEFEDMTVERPLGTVSAVEFKRAWRTVKTFAKVTFGED